MVGQTQDQERPDVDLQGSNRQLQRRSESFFFSKSQIAREGRRGAERGKEDVPLTDVQVSYPMSKGEEGKGRKSCQRDKEGREVSRKRMSSG